MAMFHMGSLIKKCTAFLRNTDKTKATKILMCKYFKDEVLVEQRNTVSVLIIVMNQCFVVVTEIQGPFFVNYSTKGAYCLIMKSYFSYRK